MAMSGGLWKVFDFSLLPRGEGEKDESVIGKVNIGMARQNSEPRWPAGIAVVAIGGLFAALPSSLTFAGSRWLLLGIVLVMMVPTVISHRIGHHFLNQILGYIGR